MTIEITDLLTFLLGLFAIVNPVGVIPIYTSYVSGLPPKMKRYIARKTIIVATIILVVFALFGYYIFLLFGITYGAFKIAGGLLLFKIGFDMLQARHPRTKHTEEEYREYLEREELAITPLATPLVAGPGAITTVVVGFYSNHTFIWKFWVVVSIVIIMAITYVIFLYSEPLLSRLGRSGVLAIHRVMGLLITAIAVEMVFQGLQMRGLI